MPSPAVQTPSQPVETSTSYPGPAAPAEEPATPAEEPAAVIALTDAWTDSGYSYEMEVNSIMPTVTVDTMKVPPGKADLSVSFEIIGTLTNSTPQRVAPLPTTMAIQPMWTHGSPPCQGPLAFTEAFSSNDAGMEEKYCTLHDTPGHLTSMADEIPFGGTVEVQATVRKELQSSEASAAELKALLGAPEMWALGRVQGGGLFYGCLMESGSVYFSVGTANPGCASESSESS